MDGKMSSTLLRFLFLSLISKRLSAVVISLNCNWSGWLNRDRPTGDGDFETLKDHLKLNREELCDNPVKVEGRVRRKHTDALVAGQSIDLDPSVGLVCRNAEQTCLDYEVRFCCSRKPRCIGGEWTYYYSVDTPDGSGDFESLSSIRLRDPHVCESPSAIDARRKSDGVHFQSVSTRRGQIKKRGNRIIGFECRHAIHPTFTLQPAVLKPIFPALKCDDYEVRLCCPKREVPPCGPNGWSIWLNLDTPHDDGCDNELLDTLRQEYPGEIKCDKPTAIDARLVSTGERYDPTASHMKASPTKGFKCCNVFRHFCGDYEVRFCCQAKPPVIPKCNGKWTGFYDRDNPSGFGDYETLEHLRRENEGEICKNPTAIDARIVGTNVHHPVLGQVVTADLTKGFYCVNSKQTGRKCMDFEVRFCCPKVPPNTCEENDWTDYHSIDDPISGQNNGDVEDLATVSAKIPEVCPNPSAIDVRLLNGAHYLSVNQQLHLSLTDGFSCYNNEQNERELCCDYKVRYCCPSGPPPVCDKCVEWKGKWTKFFNVDRPLPATQGDNCDCELLSAIRMKDPKVCEFPILIDVRIISNNSVYTSAGQNVDVSLLGGFKCVNDGQRCLDYKVRFCCLEEEKPIGKLSWCIASGDPHFNSLDGKRFDFQGNCTYTFVRTTEEAELWHLHPFTVEVEHENRISPTVSFVKRVIFKINNEVVELRNGPIILVNGMIVTLPYDDDFNGFTIEKFGRKTQLITKFGLKIIYNHNHLLEVGVPDNYKEHVEGLCGNYNEDPADDFIISETAETTDDVNVFGESHNIDDDCSSNPRGVRECTVPVEIRAHYTTCNATIRDSVPCFQSCSRLVPIDPFIQDCVYDACAMRSQQVAIESAVDAYIAACVRSGFDCPETSNCTANQTYTRCGCSTPLTCFNWNYYSADLCETTTCRQSCACDSGLALDSTHCVLPSNCACLRNNGTYWSPQCDSKCQCRNGIPRCEKADCLPQETCTESPQGYSECLIRRGK